MAASEQGTASAAEKSRVKSTTTGQTGLIRRLETVSVREHACVVTGRKRPGRTILIRRRHAAAAVEHWGVVDTAPMTHRIDQRPGTRLLNRPRNDTKRVTP